VASTEGRGWSRAVEAGVGTLPARFVPVTRSPVQRKVVLRRPSAGFRSPIRFSHTLERPVPQALDTVTAHGQNAGCDVEHHCHWPITTKCWQATSHLHLLLFHSSITTAGEAQRESGIYSGLPRVASGDFTRKIAAKLSGDVAGHLFRQHDAVLAGLGTPSPGYGSTFFYAAQ